MKKSLNIIKTNLFLCSTLSSLSKIKEINYSLSNTSKNNIRPKLNLKKSFSLNNITNSNSIKNNEKTIQIINSINITQYNNNIYNSTYNNNFRIIDEESLKIKNQQINKEINKIRKLLTNVNEQNKIKDEEINKQAALIDKILNINKQAYLDTIKNFEKNFQKDKNKTFDDLLEKIYFQFQELKINNEEINLEIKNLKKNSKNTKKNELMIENNILKNQYNKYKYLCKQIEIKNENYKSKTKNTRKLENEILEKNFEILNLQENLKISNSINIQKEEEKNQLIQRIKEYQNKNKDLKNKIKKLNQEYNYILLSKKDLEDNLYLAYNNNEINYYEKYDNKKAAISSNRNSADISNIIDKDNNNKENVNNISNTLEETLNINEINKINNKILEDENNLNTVDEEKITNIESETNFKKDFANKKEESKKEDLNIVNNENLSDKNGKKYNESFIEQNSDMTNTNEN
jgi:hypothetical protein